MNMRVAIPLILLAAGVLLNGATWAVALYVFPQDRVAAILHYNTSVGIDFIGEGNQITALPLIGTTLLVGNGLLALFLRRQRRAAAMFWTIIPAVEAILFVAMMLILRLNQ